MNPAPLPLEVRGAVRSYGKVRAIDGIDLDLRPGELLVLVGPSGCGKSTLLRSIAGLVPLDAGSIAVGGDVVDDGRRASPPERRHVGMVFQDHALFPHLTIGDNIAFGIRKRPAAERRTTVAELAAMVEIDHLVDRYPHEVSGGERQRASVARAVAPAPRLLLLDEPFAALDPNLRAQVRTQLVALLRATETPAVFVSHDQAEAMALGDRVAVLRAGKVEQLGSGPEVYDRPANRFVAGFMGDAAFLPARPVGVDRYETALGTIHSPTHAGEDRCCRDDERLAVIRPADVALVADPEATSEVVGRSYQGPTWTYDVRLASGEVIGSTVGRHVVFEVGTRVMATHAGAAPALIAADPP